MLRGQPSRRQGKPFKPDARMQRIFDQAAKRGVAMGRAILYASREPEIDYWPDRHWEEMFVRNTEFLVDGYRDIDARTLWFYQAIVLSPNLLSTTPGVGTAESPRDCRRLRRDPVTVESSTLNNVPGHEAWPDRDG